MDDPLNLSAVEDILEKLGRKNACYLSPEELKMCVDEVLSSNLYNVPNDIAQNNGSVQLIATIVKGIIDDPEHSLKRKLTMDLHPIHILQIIEKMLDDAALNK